MDLFAAYVVIAFVIGAVSGFLIGVFAGTIASRESRTRR
jgi:hypothetical protein